MAMIKVKNSSVRLTKPYGCNCSRDKHNTDLHIFEMSSVLCPKLQCRVRHLLTVMCKNIDFRWTRALEAITVMHLENHRRALQIGVIRKYRTRKIMGMQNLKGCE